MASFKASARSLDQGIGAVLNGLHQFGLNERTLIICTTDHGLAFPNAKATLFDRGIGVMLIMRGPNGFSGGKLVDSLVSQIDLYPTLMDVAGVEHPPFLQGASLMPVVDGETDRIHDEIHAEVTYHAAYEPQRCVRTDRWKYIRRFDDYPTTVLSNCDDSATKEVMVEAGWGDELVPPEQLYDLLLDPGEARNLTESASHRETLGQMRARLEEWMERTDDPIRQGPIAAPPGAEINLPDQRSASEPPMFVAEDGSLVDEPPAVGAGAREVDEFERTGGRIR
jgi:arylsulfatase A-like enzyme